MIFCRFFNICDLDQYFCNTMGGGIWKGKTFQKIIVVNKQHAMNAKA